MLIEILTSHLFAFLLCTEEGANVSVRISGGGGLYGWHTQATMVAGSPDERFKIDGSFDSNQVEEICIDLNSSEERKSLTQRRERNEDPQANRKATSLFINCKPSCEGALACIIVVGIPQLTANVTAKQQNRLLFHPESWLSHRPLRCLSVGGHAMRGASGILLQTRSYSIRSERDKTQENLCS